MRVLAAIAFLLIGSGDDAWNDERVLAELRGTVERIPRDSSLEQVKKYLGEPRGLSIDEKGMLHVLFFLSRSHEMREVHLGIEGTFKPNGDLVALEIGEEWRTQWITCRQFDRVRIGDTEAAVIRNLGPPELTQASSGSTLFSYKMRSCEYPQHDMLFVTIDIRKGRVTGKQAVWK